MPESPGVSLPGDSAPVDCANSSSMGMWTYTHGHEAGDEGRAAGVCGGHVGDQGAENAEGSGGFGQQFHRVGG